MFNVRRLTRFLALSLVAALVLAACSDAPDTFTEDGVTFKAYVVTLSADPLGEVSWALNSSPSSAQSLTAQAVPLEATSAFAGKVQELSFTARPGDTLSLSGQLQSGDTLEVSDVALFEEGQAVSGEVSGQDSFKVILEPTDLETQAFSFVPDIKLLGVNEVPSVKTPAYGSADALLIFNFLILFGSFDDLQGDLFEVAGSPAHVHAGERGENGPIVFNLDVTPRSDNRSGSFTGFGILPDTSVVADGGLYINLHTEAFNGGELRGQVSLEQPEGAVFTLDNEADGNDVVASARWTDGRLFGKLSFGAGGDGDGNGLSGTSNPLVVTKDHKYLFAVNGGSDEISAFKISNLTNLELVGTVKSNGKAPISVAVYDDLLYVLNAGRGDHPGNIAGFNIHSHGKLSPLSRSKQLLDGTPSDANVPAQILFSPDGEYLVVTDRSPNSTITTFRVRNNGRAEAPVTQASVGATPFGFEFAPNGVLVVSEAQGGPPNISSVSSYTLEQVRKGGLRFGQLSPISEEVSTERLAACWVEITENGRYAYTTNTGSGDVTGFRLAPDGTLTRLPDDVAFTTTGAGPLDMENVGSDFLYIQSFEDDGDAQVASYRVVQGTGELVSLSSRIPDLPESARGVAAY